MTTQPSDWAVARAYWEVVMNGTGGLQGPYLIGRIELRARELDARRGDSSVQDFIAAMVKAHGYAPALNDDGTLLNGRDEDRYQGWLLATPQPTEAGTTNSAQISSSLVVGEAGSGDSAAPEKAKNLCVHCFSPPEMWGMICCQKQWDDPQTELLTETQVKERKAAMGAVGAVGAGGGE